MGTVKAKFKIDRYETSLFKNKKDHTKPWSVENTATYEQRTIIMTPVYSNNDPNSENSKFWAATPTGEIRLGTVNPEAWEHLPLGREVYVTFEVAEDDVK